MTFYQLPEQHIRNGRLADRPATIGAIGWGYVANDEPALYIAGDDMQWHKVGGSDGASLGDGAAIYKDLSGNTLQFRSVKTSSNGITVTENANDVTLALAALDATLLTAGTVDSARLPTIAVAKGGTGGTTALQARTNLGLLIGTDVQAHSTNLDGWSALSTSAKANTVHTHAATDIVSGALATARGGSGADNSTGEDGEVMVRSGTNGNFVANGSLLFTSALRVNRAGNNPAIVLQRDNTDIAQIRGVLASNIIGFASTGGTFQFTVNVSTGAASAVGDISAGGDFIATGGLSVGGGLSASGGLSLGLGATIRHTGTSAIAILAGADVNASSVTNNTRKLMRLAVPNYINAEEPVGVVFVDSDSGYSRLYIGGGTTAVNAATDIIVRVATNTVTQSGDTMLQIGYNTIGFLGNSPVAAPAWGAVSGTISRAAFDTGTVTLAQLAQRVGRIIEDLRTVGLFKT